MSRWASIVLLTAVVGFPLVSPRVALACPSCEAAAASPTTEPDDDPLREARAINRSILLMVAVPYALLAACGLGLYSLYRTKKQLESAAAQGSSTSLNSN